MHGQREYESSEQYEREMGGMVEIAREGAARQCLLTRHYRTNSCSPPTDISGPA